MKKQYYIFFENYSWKHEFSAENDIFALKYSHYYVNNQIPTIVNDGNITLYDERGVTLGRITKEPLMEYFLKNYYIGK